MGEGTATTRRVVHYNANPTTLGFRWRSAMCGSFVYAVATTPYPADVTCGNCKRTIAYKARAAENGSPAP